MLYAQVIDGFVNLIGGEEIGLPLPKYYLQENPDILNIDITEMEEKPQVGYYYVDGTFYSPEEYQEMNPVVYPKDSVYERLDAISMLLAQLVFGMELPEETEFEVKQALAESLPVAEEHRAIIREQLEAEQAQRNKQTESRGI